jgi:hypothetical protein
VLIVMRLLGVMPKYEVRAVMLTLTLAFSTYRAVTVPAPEMMTLPRCAVNTVHVPLKDTLHVSPDPANLNPVVPVIAVNATGEPALSNEPDQPGVQMTLPRLLPGPTVTVLLPVLKTTSSPMFGTAPAK